MQSLLLKLEADIAARKRPQSAELWLTARHVSLGLLLLWVVFRLGALSAETPGGWLARERLAALHDEIETAKGEIQLQRAQIERLERIHENSARYGIGADLAAMIEDIALAENVDPRLAFDLVRVESEFKRRAVSPVGALGYTQLMPETARILAPGIKPHQLFDSETNLRLGFRFLHSLLARYDGNVILALTAYNRGPTTVDRLLKQGVDPTNGYADAVLGKKPSRSR
jgi:soluble lytic murein transglycosylase-like protein